MRLGRFENEIMAGILYAMTKDYGYTWPLSNEDIDTFLQKAHTAYREEAAIKQRLCQKYACRYKPIYAQRIRRWQYLSWATFGLANLFGLNKKPLSWEEGIYRRASAFTKKLVPEKYAVMIDHFGVGQGYGSGIIGIRDLGGLKVDTHDDGYSLSLLPPLERLFESWGQREWRHLETAH
ncbi:MAG: hypothetical protein KIH67_001300 [Candidatus Moranbacteria bacterium]|nr:hypothetical protein [Candidatus Moranbacteria bacterium]